MDVEIVADKETESKVELPKQTVPAQPSPVDEIKNKSARHSCPTTSQHRLATVKGRLMFAIIRRSEQAVDLIAFQQAASFVAHVRPGLRIAVMREWKMPE